MHLLTHYAELVGDGSICSIEYILHQTLTLKPKLFSNCSYNQQQVRRITNDTNGRQRGLEAEKPREIWVGRGGSGVGRGQGGGLQRGRKPIIDKNNLNECTWLLQQREGSERVGGSVRKIAWGVEKIWRGKFRLARVCARRRRNRGWENE